MNPAHLSETVREPLGTLSHRACDDCKCERPCPPLIVLAVLDCECHKGQTSSRSFHFLKSPAAGRESTQREPADASAERQV